MPGKGTPWLLGMRCLQGDVTLPVKRPRGPHHAPPMASWAHSLCQVWVPSGPLFSGTRTAQLEPSAEGSLTWGPEPLGCSLRPAAPSSRPGRWAKGMCGQTEVPGALSPGCAPAPLQSQEGGPHGPLWSHVTRGTSSSRAMRGSPRLDIWVL